MPNSSAHSPEEEPPYPSSNGGYYNRKVYSDSYFAPTQTLRRTKKDRKSSNENPPDLVSPTQPVYARVGPPGLSWRNATPSLSSFTPHKQVYHASTRSEPGNMLWIEWFCWLLRTRISINTLVTNVSSYVCLRKTDRREIVFIASSHWICSERGSVYWIFNKWSWKGRVYSSIFLMLGS